ncbi:hypothetical protein BT96DRAFT_991383 [Gymnopus androsaceus JB14]|uniref:Uncharacterized protein n=1 Tax=Gymnopus androsaceus JB14 TaxID=1447944 RepID=A0A6A4I081_9AGAR|nr:hypothetical protein BT96DRAFT_991383 [Gymnopus androsaceus JB14]
MSEQFRADKILSFLEIGKDECPADRGVLFASTSNSRLDCHDIILGASARQRRRHRTHNRLSSILSSLNLTATAMLSDASDDSVPVPVPGIGTNDANATETLQCSDSVSDARPTDSPKSHPHGHPVYDPPSMSMSSRRGWMFKKSWREIRDKGRVSGLGIGNGKGKGGEEMQKWALKEIVDYIQVPLDDLLVPPSTRTNAKTTTRTSLSPSSRSSTTSSISPRAAAACSPRPRSAASTRSMSTILTTTAIRLKVLNVQCECERQGQ